MYNTMPTETERLEFDIPFNMI